MRKLAVISVYDKFGLEKFVHGLMALGVEILSTGGTAKFLTEKGIKIQSIDEYTGSPEILGGRVKTLHPKVHGGILARREFAEDLKQLDAQKISLIDFVVVNLYPFLDKVQEVLAGKISADESLVEHIDIGGPTMIRAAAKNWRHVVPVCDPSDYESILAELAENKEVSVPTRKRLAAKVFTTMAAYDSAVARYFSLKEKLMGDNQKPIRLAPTEAVVIEQIMPLRYGENPHQEAGLYRSFRVGHAGLNQTGLSQAKAENSWQVLQGKELSYNNLLDMHAALDLFLDLRAASSSQVPAVVIKHSNPCGAAYAKDALSAFKAARDCDPVSAFGGIVVVGGKITASVAEEMSNLFLEVVLVDDLDVEAAEVFSKKKNLRLVRCSFSEYRRRQEAGALSFRNFFGDYLVQTTDNQIFDLSKAKVVSKIKPDAPMLEDLQFAWIVAKHVKSNAIVIVKQGRAIGIGAGQMSRWDSAKLAIERARVHGHSVEGAVAASDAFLPFPDTLEVLQAAGVKALVQPGGSIKDQDVIKAADNWKVAMLFTGERHFRH